MNIIEINSIEVRRFPANIVEIYSMFAKEQGAEIQIDNKFLVGSCIYDYLVTNEAVDEFKTLSGFLLRVFITGSLWKYKSNGDIDFDMGRFSAECINKIAEAVSEIISWRTYISEHEAETNEAGKKSKSIAEEAAA